MWERPGREARVYAQRYAPSGEAVGASFKVDPVPPGPASYAAQGDAAVAMAPDGAFVVVWTGYSFDEGSPEVVARRFTPEGLPVGPAFRVNATTDGMQSYPSVAMSTNGFVVAWQSEGRGARHEDVCAQWYGADGTTRGGETLVSVVTAEDQTVPVVAMTADGRAVVVWEQGRPEPGHQDVHARWFGTDGAVEGGAVRVNDGREYAASPAVALDGAGRALIVWEDGPSLFPWEHIPEGEAGRGVDVLARRYAPDGTALGEAFRVNTRTRHEQTWPSVAVDAAGDALVVWQSWIGDGNSADVHGQRYTTAGGAHGPEFRVNAVTAGAHVTPQVAMDAAGNAVVVWEVRTRTPTSRRVTLLARRYRGPDQ